MGENSIRPFLTPGLDRFDDISFFSWPAAGDDWEAVANLNLDVVGLRNGFKPSS